MVLHVQSAVHQVVLISSPIVHAAFREVLSAILGPWDPVGIKFQEFQDMFKACRTCCARSARLYSVTLHSSQRILEAHFQDTGHQISSWSRHIAELCRIEKLPCFQFLSQHVQSHFAELGRLLLAASCCAYQGLSAGLVKKALKSGLVQLAMTADFQRLIAKDLRNMRGKR